MAQSLYQLSYPGYNLEIGMIISFDNSFHFHIFIHLSFKGLLCLVVRHLVGYLMMLFLLHFINEIQGPSFW